MWTYQLGPLPLLPLMSAFYSRYLLTEPLKLMPLQLLLHFVPEIRVHPLSEMTLSHVSSYLCMYSDMIYTTVGTIYALQVYY